MVCYDSGLVIHGTHLRNMLFICTLIFQKLDVNLQGFFFSLLKNRNKIVLLPSSLVTRDLQWLPFMCPPTTALRRGQVSSNRLSSCREGTGHVPASVSEMPLSHLSVLLCLHVS